MDGEDLFEAEKERGVTRQDVYLARDSRPSNPRDARAQPVALADAARTRGSRLSTVRTGSGASSWPTLSGPSRPLHQQSKAHVDGIDT